MIVLPPALVLPADARYRPLRRHHARHPVEELLDDTTPIVIHRGYVRALMSRAFHTDDLMRRERGEVKPGECVACDLINAAPNLAQEYVP